MPVMLVERYNPEWPAWFQRICSVLEPALAQRHLTIEHVGSTAAPGMVAKPIIDLDIVIAPDRFAEIVMRLSYAGICARRGSGHCGARGL